MYYFDPLIKDYGYRPASAKNFPRSGILEKPDDERKLKRICSQFEAIFLGYLFLQMKKTIPESGFLEEGLAHRIYEEEFYTVVAEKMAEAGGIGLARILYQQLKNKVKNSEGGLNGGNKQINRGFKKGTWSL